MTEEQLCELPIPKWLGRPMYPGGIPLNMDQISFEGKTVREIYLKRCEDIVANREPNEDGDKFLCYYALYKVHAPIWLQAGEEYTNELRSQLSEEMTVDEIIHKCMEYGIDPF